MLTMVVLGVPARANLGPLTAIRGGTPLESLGILQKVTKKEERG